MKFSDGKSLGGVGRLTQPRIDSMQRFYGMALRQNRGNPAAMSRATWAILKHYADPADHYDCPEGADSWCKWQSDQATAQQTYQPVSNPLSPAIVERITPIFRDLANLSLLENCTKCMTQNANESLHHLIWGLVPKDQYNSPDKVHLGVHLGILFFNQGRLQSILDMFNMDGSLTLSQRSHLILQGIDTKRIVDVEYQQSKERKEKRHQRRHKKLLRLDAFSKKEGTMYKSGEFHQSKKRKAISSESHTKAPRKCRKCGQPLRGHPKKSCPPQPSTSNS